MNSATEYPDSVALSVTLAEKHLHFHPRALNRVVKLLAGLRALRVDIRLTDTDEDDPGHLIFSEDVCNRYDDADPRYLGRYLVVERMEDEYALHSYPTLRKLRGELQAIREDDCLVAFDLDANKVLRPMWRTTVRFQKADA